MKARSMDLALAKLMRHRALGFAFPKPKDLRLNRTWYDRYLEVRTKTAYTSYVSHA